MQKTLVVMFCLLFITNLAFAYGPWGEQTLQTEVVLDYLDKLDAAIELATAGQSAHPAFLADLVIIAAGLREALDNQQSNLDWGSYSSPLSSIVPNIAGEWSAAGGIAKGKLILTQQGSTLTGSIFGDAIADGKINPDGSIYFVRTGPKQVYTGSLDQSGTQISGTFDCPVTRTTKTSWTATLIATSH